MSVEKNLHEVKERLAEDQNLLVSAFRLETLYKRYKKYIFIIISLLVIFGIYKGITAYREHRTTEEADKLLNTLYSKTVSDDEKKIAESKLATIKPILYDFYRYTKLQNLSPLQIKSDENLAILKELSQSKNPLIATLASYQYASFSENLEMLENFKADVAPILRDRARFQAAYLYIQNNNIQKAQEILKSIQPSENNQIVVKMASLLRHYGVSEAEQGIQANKGNTGNNEDNMDTKNHKEKQQTLNTETTAKH